MGRKTRSQKTRDVEGKVRIDGNEARSAANRENIIRMKQTLRRPGEGPMAPKLKSKHRRPQGR